MNRSEMISLVNKIIKFRGADEELSEMIETLKKETGCPEVSDYIFWEDLTAEEVINKALAYKPIQL